MIKRIFTRTAWMQFLINHSQQLCWLVFYLLRYFKITIDFEILQSNRRTTDDNHFQDVRLISLAVNDVKWSPGDVLMLRPRNADDKVAELFELFAEHGLDFREDTVVQIRQFDDGKFIVQLIIQVKKKLYFLA